MPKTGIILTICAVAVICITAVAQKKTTNYQSMNEMETLDLKWQDMVAIACLEAKGDVDRLAQAIRNGLDSGLTVNQIKEALSQLYAYTGFPRSLNGLGVLQRISEARKAEDIKDDEGQDAEPLPKDYNALKYGTEVQTQLTGGKPFNYTFAPATDYYLKAHLFGDIFARNNLSFAERELVTISALCGLKGVESQLASHVRGARNMGLSDTAIRAIPASFAAKGGRLGGLSRRQGHLQGIRRTVYGRRTHRKQDIPERRTQHRLCQLFYWQQLPRPSHRGHFTVA